MISQSNLQRASPLAREFHERIGVRLRDVEYSEEFSDRYEFSIRARHPAVGELRVRDDGDELTISLGVHHHWHVPEYLFENEPVNRRHVLAAEAAVESVASVLENRTVIRVSRESAHSRGSMSYSRASATVKPLTADEEEFFWSGPRGSE